MIKTNDLVVGKLISIGDTQVSQDQEEKEDQRLAELLTSSRQQDRQRKQQQKIEDQMRALIQAIPGAFQFSETQTETGSRGEMLVHFAFQPDPNFKPANVDLELLRGLAGTMVIDARRKQVAHLEAHLFRDVDFGWGILVHLNKGGTLRLDRGPVDGSSGNMIRNFSLALDGRILVLKKFDLRWNFDHFVCFRKPVGLASAIAMLASPTLLSAIPQ